MMNMIAACNTNPTIDGEYRYNDPFENPNEQTDGTNSSIVQVHEYSLLAALYPHRAFRL